MRCSHSSVTKTVTGSLNGSTKIDEARLKALYRWVNNEDHCHTDHVLHDGKVIGAPIQIADKVAGDFGAIWGEDKEAATVQRKAVKEFMSEARTTPYERIADAEAFRKVIWII